MNEILRLLKTFEVFIYILLGLVGFYYLQKFVFALKEWHGTIFGLERENAQRRLNEAVAVLSLSILIAAGEFIVTTFVIPIIPGMQLINTPTLDILASPTATLPVLPTNLQTNDLPASRVTLTVTPTNGSPQNANGCIPGKIDFTSPTDGADVTGIVQLKGHVAISNFGFYKYEFSIPGSNTWVTIAAGNEIKPDGSLGFWDVSLLVPGDYLLHLIVYDNQGQQSSPCVISVKVATPVTTP
jgi:hypothetical protein